jgi:hypothetical protein
LARLVSADLTRVVLETTRPTEAEPQTYSSTGGGTVKSELKHARKALVSLPRSELGPRFLAIGCCEVLS